MGLLDLFRRQTIPIIQVILPDVAKQEILKGRLPILNTNKIFLKNGEHCHYIEKAIYEKKVVNKCYQRRGGGLDSLREPECILAEATRMSWITFSMSRSKEFSILPIDVWFLSVKQKALTSHLTL
jgi:hypothetical protein